MSRKYLIDAAIYADKKMAAESGLSIQILVRPDHVLVRACSGGIFKTWFERKVEWDDVAELEEHIDHILFQCDRHRERMTGDDHAKDKPNSARA